MALNLVGEVLLESCQRYKFKSNSQLFCGIPIFAPSCWNLVKDINSKAIHNYALSYDDNGNPVGILSKI